MNKWKVAFFVVLAFALAGNAFLLYHTIDMGVSYTYLQDSHAEQIRRFDVLGELVVAGSDEYTKADILHLLRQVDRSAFIVEEESSIHYREVTFVFENDKLSAVQ